MQASDELPDDLIGLAEAAAILPSRKRGRKIHTTTVWRWIRTGKIEGWKVAGEWRVSARQVRGLARLVRTTPELLTRRQREGEIAAAQEELREKWG